MSLSVDIYAWPGAYGLLSASPFCLKVFYASQYKGLETKLVSTTRVPRWAKRDKLPVATVNGNRVEDSTEILRALDALEPKKRLYPDDPYLRQEVILLEDWCDESLVLNLVFNRWCVPENYERFSEQIFKGLPNVIKRIVKIKLQRDVFAFLKRQGIASLPDVVRKQRFEEHVGCLETRLSKNQFLVCDHPTAADFSAFATLQSIKLGHFKETEAVFSHSKNLEAWMLRMTNAING